MDLSENDITRFMEAYFSSRTLDIKLELVRRRPFREQFYTDDCPWDSKSEAINDSDGKHILGIARDQNHAYVITSGITRKDLKFRYTLIQKGHELRIKGLEFECKVCAATKQYRTCPCCGGRGWS